MSSKDSAQHAKAGCALSFFAFTRQDTFMKSCGTSESDYMEASSERLKATKAEFNPVCFLFRVQGVAENPEVSHPEPLQDHTQRFDIG